MAYRRASLHASDPQDCIYTKNLNMSWDVPECWGQLAQTAGIRAGCMPAGNGPDIL